MSKNQYDVVIIGAGHNGLVAANYLARDGLSVLLLERRDIIGGGSTTEEFSPGFLVSNCATSVWGLQPKIIDELELRKHGFELVETGMPRLGTSANVSANSRTRVHVFPDGTYIGGPSIKTDEDKIAQIREMSEHDAEAFPKWIEFWESAGSIFQPYLMTEPPTLAEVMRVVAGTPKEDILEKLLTWSFLDIVHHFFENEYVKAHVINPGVHESDPSAAGSPLAAAIFSTVSFGSRNDDRGIPKMGMGTITASIAGSARSVGVEIRTEAPVREVIVEDGAAAGVRLETGEEIRSRLVVSNADPKRTFTTLFRDGDVDEETLKRVKRWKTQAGCLKFLAAMKELPDLSRYLGDDYDREQIVGMKILPSVEYYQNSWNDAAAGIPTRYPALGIQLSTTVDHGLANGRGHVMATYAPFAAGKLAEGTWDDAKQEVGERIIDIITECAPNFRDSLIDWEAKTPLDIQRRVGMTDGNIRHLDMIPSQLLAQRQPYRTSVKNFYMCGAGTHPMGEVIGIPGHNAAHAILKDLNERTS